MGDEIPPMASIIAPASPGLVTARANEIEATEIRWLWPNRAALGKLLMLAGDPGLGKSLFTLDIAARVSCGSPWPVDGGNAPLGNVLLVSAEDDAGDTIVPRLVAAGADLERIHVLCCVRDYNAEGEPVERELNLERDVALIAQRLAEIDNCRLVVIDPISAYLGRIDSHRNTEVRSVLAPLSKLAQETGAAFVLVSHLNKGTGTSAAYRVTGSIAFTAAVRASLLVVKDKDDPLRRLVLTGKNNLGADSVGGIAYRVAQNVTGKPYLEFEPNPVMVSADEALDPFDDEQTYARDEAEEFLRDYLEAGAAPANDVVKAAAAAGISKRTLERAKAKLGIYSGRRQFSGGIWYWSLRPLKDAKTANTTDSHNGGGLRGFGGLREGINQPDTNNASTITDGGLRESEINPIPKTAKTSKTANVYGVDSVGGLGDVGEEGTWSTIL